MPNPANTLNARPRLFVLGARIASIVLLAAMFIGTHLPAHISPGITFSDKAIHFSAFMVLAISLLINLELSFGALLPWHYFAVWLSCTLYGAFDEITQIPVGRSCDGLDWLADIAGIVAGLTVFRLLNPLWNRQSASGGVQ